MTALLQELIRLDTVNPPGNETRAAEAVQRYLCGNGVESRLVAKTPERASLVALLEGGDGPGLVLLAHTDRCSRRLPSGRATRGRATSSTVRSGAVARST